MDTLPLLIESGRAVPPESFRSLLARLIVTGVVPEAALPATLNARLSNCGVPVGSPLAAKRLT